MKPFPTLATAIESTGAKKKRVLIVTMDLMGPIRNGGIGTACTSLAEALAQTGHDVTVFFAGAVADEDANFDYWQINYRERGIRLLSITEPEYRLQAPYDVRLAHRTYTNLRELGEEFDIVHFPDYRGLGYFCLLAKHQGLFFQNSTLIVTAHGPSAWIDEGNRGLPNSIESLSCYDLERMSIELADMVVCPSQFAGHWMSEQGWKLPKSTYVQNYILPTSTSQKYTGSRSQFDEIIFFGRLETRKGLEIFCEAILKMDRKHLKGMKITFLGRPGYVAEHNWSDLYFKNQASRLRFKYQIFSEMNQEDALQYILSRNALVIIPSITETLGFTTIECVKTEIPFLASDIPAFREVIHPDDFTKATFALTVDGLANKMSDAIASGVPKIRIHPTLMRAPKDYVEWHSRHTPVAKKPAKPTNSKVSVCIPHKDRPKYLSQALESLNQQTYKNIEVVVADDGSETAEASAFLDSCVRDFQNLKIKVIRNPSSTGPCLARNRAAEIATGEFLLFMDDDNIAKPDEVECLLNVQAETRADVVSCGFERFRGKSPNADNSRVKYSWLPYSHNLSVNIFTNAIADTNMLIRRSSFLQVGGFAKAQGVAFEDFELAIRLLNSESKIEHCPEMLFYYRDHDDNFSKVTNSFQSMQLRIHTLSQSLLPEMKPFLQMCFAWAYKLGTFGDPFQVSPLVNPSRKLLPNSVTQHKESVVHSFRVKKQEAFRWTYRDASCALKFDKINEKGIVYLEGAIISASPNLLEVTIEGDQRSRTDSLPLVAGRNVVSKQLVPTNNIRGITVRLKHAPSRVEVESLSIIKREV